MEALFIRHEHLYIVQSFPSFMGLKYLFIFVIFTVSTRAGNFVSPGTLSIAMIEDCAPSGKIMIENDALKVGGISALFDFCDRDALELFASKRWVNVNKKGLLYIGSKPDRAFRLAFTEKGVQVLLYDDNLDFELCEDGRIGIKSQCTGATTIRIVYRELI